MLQQTLPPRDFWRTFQPVRPILLEAPLRVGSGQAMRCVGVQRGDHQLGRLSVRRDRDARRAGHAVANLGVLRVRRLQMHEFLMHSHDAILRRSVSNWNPVATARAQPSVRS